MHTHRTPERLKEHALLDRAVLNLMLDSERQRPWAEDEIARELNVPGDVRESLRRLRACKLIHRWNDLAVAAHAAVRYHEISQAVEKDMTPGDREERHWEHAVLEGLIVRAVDGQGPRSLQQTYEAFGATKRKRKLKIADALDRLEGAGLVERRAERSIASDAIRQAERQRDREDHQEPDEQRPQEPIPALVGTGEPSTPSFGGGFSPKIMVRPSGLEPPRTKRSTRPSTLRVYQFRHRRRGSEYSPTRSARRAGS
jgi:hypothetical protein